MTAQTSANNIINAHGGSKTGAYLLYRLVQLRLHLVAVTVISALIYIPVAVTERNYIFALIEYEREKRAGADVEILDRLYYSVTYSDESLVWFMLALAAAVGLIIMCYAVMYRNFRYLCERVYSDMELSLPLTGGQRLFAGLGTGAAVCVVPQLFAILAARLIYLPAYDTAAAENVTQRYFANFIMSGSLCMPAACLSFICSAVFIMILCGKKAQAMIMPFFYNVAAVLMTLFVSYLAYSSARGVEPDDLLSNIPAPFTVCPFGMIIMMLGMLNERDELSAVFTDSVTVMYIVLLILLIGGSYLLIRHRKEHLIGSAFIYPFQKNVFHFVLSLTLGALAFIPAFSRDRTWISVAYFSVNIPAPAVIAAWVGITLIAFLVTELFDGMKPDVRGIFSALGRYAVISAAVFAVCFAVTKTQAFGRALYVPDVSEIKSVNIYTHSMYSIPMDYSRYEDHVPENPGVVTALHKRLIEEAPPEGSPFTVTLRYVLADGKATYRTYDADITLLRAAETAIFESGLFLDAYRLPDTGENGYLDDVCYYDYRVDSYDADHMITHTNIPPERLEEAMLLDAKAADASRFFSGALLPGAVVTVNGAGDTDYIKKTYSIYTFFDNTLALFEEYGIDPFADRFKHDAALLTKCEYDSNTRNITNDSVEYDYLTGKYSSTENVRIPPLDSALDELINNCTAFPMFEKSGEIYRLELYRKYRNSQGREVPVCIAVLYATEDHTDKAAALWESCAECDPELYNSYLGISGNGYDDEEVYMYYE